MIWFDLVLGLDPAVLGADSWPQAQGSLLAGRREPHVVLRIEPGWAQCQIVLLPAVLLQAPSAPGSAVIGEDQSRDSEVQHLAS